MPPAKKATAKKAPAKKAAAKKAPAAKATAKPPTTLRVRMYRVGFGDFFLITVPTDSGPQHILVDCGVYADHIIGFSRCASDFKKFTVDAIWMSAWETEYAAKVEKFQADLTQLVLNLGVALAGRQDRITDEIRSIVENATGEGPGGGSNAKSLEILKTQLGVKPQYLAEGDTPKLPPALRRAGLTAEIIGPPPVDEFDFLDLMDLKKGVGQYLDNQDNDGDTDDTEHSQGSMPFAPEYKRPSRTIRRARFANGGRERNLPPQKPSGSATRSNSRKVSIPPHPPLYSWLPRRSTTS
jgi:hypothetical protein